MYSQIFVLTHLGWSWNICLSKVLVIFAYIFFSSSTGLANDCPKESSASSSFCCNLADPLDGMDVASGGYGWQDISGNGLGLCHGLASSAVSNPVVTVLDLREKSLFTDIPDQIDIHQRSISGTNVTPTQFIGKSARDGRNFLMAGVLESGMPTMWETRTFRKYNEKLSSFGFSAELAIDGVPVYTPLVLTEAGQVADERESATLLLKSSHSIQSARITFEALNPTTLLTTGKDVVELAYTEPATDLLSIELTTDLPETFMLSIGICLIGFSNCDLETATQTINIIWPTE